MDPKTLLVIITLYFNSLLGISDRILQILYYCYTNKWKEFQTDTAKKISLTFCIFPSAFHFILILTYVIFHNEKILTPCVKFKNFFLYLFSSEFLYVIGIQKSFITKYSENADNPLTTMKILNAVHILFISVPQTLVVTINSAARDSFKGIDIASITLSVLFMVWSLIYYFLCVVKEIDYDDYITLSTYKKKYD